MKKIIIVLALIGFLLFTEVGRSVWQAGLIIPNLLPNNSVRPLEWITSKPVVETVIVSTTTAITADLYLPPHGNIDKAFLFIPGANELGRRDPRIENFGQTLARAGVAVLIPDFADITAQRFTPGSINEVTEAYKYLLSRFPGKEDGMAAFSIASGPMFIAASSPELRSRINFLISFGSYFDLKDVLRSATTLPDSDPTEVAEIRNQFQSYFGMDATAQALLNNKDPQKFDALYDNLSPAIKQFVDEMSLGQYLGNIEAKEIFLVHSDPDHDVPTIESQKLKDALGNKADLVILRSFDHTDVHLVGLGPKTFFTFYTPEVWKLYKLMFKILII